MNRRALQAIVIRDVKSVMRAKAVMLPMIIVPLILMVLMPLGVGLSAPVVAAAGNGLDDLQVFLENLPPSLQVELQDLGPTQQYVFVTLVYFFAPLFLILPLMTASVIAADSFAGEKERKTLEALLYTPTSDLELFVGKLLSAWIPALVVTLVGFVAYAVSANAGAWGTMGRIYVPNAMWIVMVFWVAPAAAGLGLSSMVLVSARVSTFQEAYQLGGMVVLPIVLLVLGQAQGVLYLGTGVVALLGAVLWAIDAVLIWYGVRTFRRSEIIARL